MCPRLTCFLAPPQAYYALAKQYHPDTNKSADAEAKFQELSKAYETLKDDEQRRLYDQVGHSSYEQAGGAPGGAGGNPFAGGGFGGGFNPFGGAAGFRGGRVEFNDADFEDILGSFFLRGGVRPSRDVAVTVQLEFMEAAKGTTKSVRLPPAAGGRVVELNIPAGVDNGVRLRLDGAGVPATGRQPAGNLFVDVQVRDHPRFVREGPNLHVEAPIGIDTAALGGCVVGKSGAVASVVYSRLLSPPVCSISGL